jgi:preprotein translocase subunit SecG
VVGVHFWPLAAVLKSPSLIVLGTLLMVAAVVAILISRRTGVAPSAITGAGAGTALLGFAGCAAVSVLA